MKKEFDRSLQKHLVGYAEVWKALAEGDAMEEMTITQKYLRENPNHIFVFGDNTRRVGKGGAAILRGEPNTYGFITKILPTHDPASYYKEEEYAPIYKEEIEKLIKTIKANPTKTYLISRVGAGLANKHHIFESIIEPQIRWDLKDLPNIEFLW